MAEGKKMVVEPPLEQWKNLQGLKKKALDTMIEIVRERESEISRNQKIANDFIVIGITVMCIFIQSVWM